MRTMPRELLVLFTPRPILPLHEDQIDRLRYAHPRVRVELTPNAEAFTEAIRNADGTIGYFEPVSVLSGRAPRLRWIQGLGVGAEGLLVPELLTAEHITLTTSKGPRDWWPGSSGGGRPRPVGSATGVVVSLQTRNFTC